MTITELFWYGTMAEAPILQFIKIDGMIEISSSSMTWKRKEERRSMMNIIPEVYPVPRKLE